MHLNLIHNANVDKFVRFIPKRELEFEQYGQRIRKVSVASDLSKDNSMDSEPCYSAEETKAEPVGLNSVHSVNTAELGAESEQSFMDCMDANAPAMPDFKLVSVAAPKIAVEDTESSSLPAQSQPATLKQGFKKI